MNVLEATASQNVRVRERLLETIARFADGRPILGFPIELLRDIGEAILRGDERMTMEPQGLDAWLHDSKLAAARQPDAVRLLSGIGAYFDRVLDHVRRDVQKELGQLDVLDSWDSAADFLDGPWGDADNLRFVVDSVWSAIGLSGDAPVESLFSNPAWRMLVDVEGMAMYQRVVVKQLAKQVQWRDLMQLVYMAGSQHRIIAMADKAFWAAATVLVTRRHPGARAMLIHDLIPSSSS
jgi:hypothetical protein